LFNFKIVFIVNHIVKACWFGHRHSFAFADLAASSNLRFDHVRKFDADEAFFRPDVHGLERESLVAFSVDLEDVWLNVDLEEVSWYRYQRRIAERSNVYLRGGS